MGKLTPFEQIDAGGVDSRSNPINMPRNRALRCLNWVPKQAGFWELRWGYSSVTMNTATVQAIHSIFPYRTGGPSGSKYVLFAKGNHLYTLDLATGAVTEPPVRGPFVVGTSRGAGYFANNRFHYGNGFDQKWYDGTTWRTNGIQALDQVATLAPGAIGLISVVEGVRELTTTQASTVTLAASGGGTFNADTLTGRQIYIAIFDPVFGEIGPATISVSSGRIVMGASQKLTVANMPNLSSVNSSWVKLIAGTQDGGGLGYFFTNTSTNLLSIVHIGVFLTVTANSHGLTSGDIVILAGTGTGNYDSVYQVTVLDVNTFRVTLTQVTTAGNTGAVGTVKRIVTASNTATSIDVVDPTQDMSYQVNQDLGLPASTIGGANPGYQFHLSIYNVNGGGHIGNRVAIGARALQTAYRSNWRIFNMPDLSGTDTEWSLLIGRTGDGAQVPYPCTDNSGNFAVVQNGQGFYYLNQASIDGAHEMPTRNGVINPRSDMFCVAGDFIYSGDKANPYLRRSGDLSQAVERANTVLGRPEQSWAPDDIDTFPTGEALTGMFEVDQEVFCGTLHDSAISTNLAGIVQWVGPWNVGIAGARSGTKAGAWGFYWLSGDKQLCTFSQGVPVVVSDEYELSELSQIGDAFLSTVELVYYRNAAKNKDELRIEGQQQDGTPYTVIHDFKLREPYSAPGSLYGQGYSSQFVGPLASLFTTAAVRDADGKLQVYAGATNGKIYQLYSGADDVGNQYDADMILLVNGGTQRPSVPFLDWYGDGNINVSVGKTLSTSLAPGAEFTFDALTPLDNPAQVVQGSENDFLYRAYLHAPEVQHIYIRFQLTSHSGDGNLDPNTPLHVPLETYGRIYELIPAIGDQRDR